MNLTVFLLIYIGKQIYNLFKNCKSENKVGLRLCRHLILQVFVIDIWSYILTYWHPYERSSTVLTRVRLNRYEYRYQCHNCGFAFFLYQFDSLDCLISRFKRKCMRTFPKCVWLCLNYAKMLFYDVNIYLNLPSRLFAYISFGLIVNFF